MSDQGAGAVGTPAAPGGAAPAVPATPAANDNGRAAVAVPKASGGGEAQGNAATVAEAIADAGGPSAIDLAGADGDRPVTIKIDGEMVTMALRDAMSDVMRSKAAYGKMREAASTKRDAEQLLTAMRERPGEVLRQLGPQAFRSALRDALRATTDANTPHEIRQIVEDEFQQLLRDAGRPQHEVEAEKREREWKDREAKIEAREKALEEQQLASAAKAHQRRFTRAFTTALGEAKVPATPDTIRAMAEHVGQLVEYGLDPSDPETIREAANLVAEGESERRKSSVTHLRDLEAEQLATELGPEALKKLAEYQLAKLQKGTPVRTVGAPTKPANDDATAPAKKYRTPAEALRAMEADRLAGRGPYRRP